MKHEEFIQGSDAWHEFRASRIGGSDSPIICGLSPWKSSLQLWMEKTKSIAPPDLTDNWAVQRGVRLEPVVRGMTSLVLGIDLLPAVFTHPEKDFLMASLDGWDEESETAVEIKVGNKKDHDALIRHRDDPKKAVPKKYYAQLQHQIYVKSPKRMFYVSYYLPKDAGDLAGDLQYVEVPRDEEFLSKYIPIVEEFRECVLKKSPPNTVKLDI